MMFSANPARGSRAVNAVVLLGVSLFLGLALFRQFVQGEPACPLCLLQRAALVLAGAGLLLNLRLGPSPLHYGMTIAAALAGMAAAGRQMLRHIAPDDPGHGALLGGLHFYTWTFMACAALIAFCALMLCMDRKWGDSAIKRRVPAAGAAVMALFFLASLGSVGGAFAQCEGGACGMRAVGAPDAPGQDGARAG
ncbi:disulfide bond formation protein B [Achromobacter sp. Marseille-Q4962]|uniref:disulfide bond formation protein B n=1 Tax=Achromobacter sp. Marseille-Q4962 TaxID=2942202 RepID=UPI0020734C08|nr:disulfide bond formation protein B [Achromobacter sp. Marseille-Q4962]